MKLTITANQRDALYEEIFAHLSGIEDVWLAVSAGDYVAARRLGREYSDDLRLVLNDLDFGDGTGEPVELRTPPEVLLRMLPRLRERAAGVTASQGPERTEVQETSERHRLVAEACQIVLADLDGESDAERPAV